MTIISAVLTAALAQTPVATPSQTPAIVPMQTPAPTPFQPPPQTVPMPSPGALPQGRPGTQPPPSGQQPARPMPMQPRSELMNNLQGFNIVLLVGESQSSGPSIEDVPAAARKALADMKEFLPFKSYRVLDSQWTSCCSNPGGSFISGRLQGVTAAYSGNEMRLVARPYSFRLGARADARLSITFSLTGDSTSGRVEQPATNSARMVELERRLAELRKEQDTIDDEILRKTRELKSNHPEVLTLEAQKVRVRQRVGETMNQLAGERAHTDVDRSNRALIDNSFTMDVGETVVVGTSRLGGDKALIAIVTAARKTGAR
jgi:hypothetical protein